jgi:hypothetical protein
MRLFVMAFAAVTGLAITTGNPTLMIGVVCGRLLCVLHYAFGRLDLERFGMSKKVMLLIGVSVLYAVVCLALVIQAFMMGAGV